MAEQFDDVHPSDGASDGMPNEIPGEAALLEDGVRVGPWRVEPQANRIENRIAQDGQEVKLEPKVMQVLLCLIRRAGKVVTKRQFMEQVWSGTVVTGDVLSRCISELRKVLGDDARNPQYIETIRKTGYRLIAPVTAAPDEATTTVPVRGNGAGAKKQVEAEEKKTPVLSGHARRIAQAVRANRQWGRRQWRWAVAAVAGALLLVGLFEARQPAPSVAEAPPQTVPFTSFPGEEMDSDLSPNGRRVTFAWNGGEGADTDIYVKLPGAEEVLRLSEHPAPERSPTWSPDGSRIAFIRSAAEGNSIVIVPAIGGRERTVAAFGERGVQSLFWSPDGEQLALAAQQEPYGPYSLYLLSVDVLRPRRRLTAPPAYYYGDLAPAFSPDGQRLAFVRSTVERVQDVYVVPVHGGTPRRLTHDGADISGLDWTADGERIIFASNREGASKLWSVPAEGGTPTWVATGGGSGLYQPSIARAGHRMTLTERSYETNIWRLAPVAAQAGTDRVTTHRVIFSTRWDSYPDVAPDGEHIAYASKRSGDFEIWISKSDGTEAVQLTDVGGAFTSTPRWSPAGDSLAFVSRKRGNADIYVAGTGGGAPRRLTEAASDEVAPAWSRDGRWIYFASNRTGAWQIWRKATGDSTGAGTLEQVTTHGGFAAAESPDGTRLYYVKKTEPGLWRRPLDGLGGGGTETKVVAGLEPYDWGNWAVTGEGIYFIERAQQPVLRYQPFGSDRAVRIAELDDLPRHPSLAAAPGGAWFLFTKVDRSESDIMLVENFR